MAHEHEFEAAPGLPEPLPAGERIVWQGAPAWWPLAVHALHVRKLALYFVAMVAVQAGSLAANGEPLADSLSVTALLAVLAMGFVLAMAWMSARSALYTLTDRRIVMRIGIVLTLSYNLPLSQIAGASLRPRGARHGDIALALKGGQRIAWLHLWPHARPWQLRQPQPMLRCLPDAQAVGALIQQTWLARNPGQAVDLGEAAPLAGAAAAAAQPAVQAAAQAGSVRAADRLEAAA